MLQRDCYKFSAKSFVLVFLFIYLHCSFQLLSLWIYSQNHETFHNLHTTIIVSILMMLGPTRVIALSRSSYHSTIHDLLAVASHLSYFPLFPVPCLEQSFFSSHILTTPSLDRNTSSASAFTTTRFKSANMSTMPAQHGHSAACCNIPPVIAKDYPIKGKYEEFGGLKSCE